MGKGSCLCPEHLYTEPPHGRAIFLSTKPILSVRFQSTLKPGVVDTTVSVLNLFHMQLNSESLPAIGRNPRFHLAVCFFAVVTPHGVLRRWVSRVVVSGGVPSERSLKARMIGSERGCCPPVPTCPGRRLALCYSEARDTEVVKKGHPAEAFVAAGRTAPVSSRSSSASGHLMTTECQS